MGVKLIIVFELQNIVDVDSEITVEVLDAVAGVAEVAFEAVTLKRKKGDLNGQSVRMKVLSKKN